MERRGDHQMDDVCPRPDADEARIESLRERLLDVAGLSELFRVLADETRTKILYLLAAEELCVHDLARILDLTLPTISHHLRLMRLMRLVKSRREGKHVYYSLSDDHVLQLIQTAQEHYQEE
ncbi:ArsR/SmtB family transcription factor [Symbiobacterium thermophilum]|nr:metalloregulator ArsR/SmtB family transcription factor [Symbiobacterium thermophilum]